MRRNVTLAALMCSAFFGSACYPPPVHIEQVSFADRQRLDRKALSDEQRAADVTVGTFRDGSNADGDRSTLVSEIVQSNLPGRAVNNLPLSDCYWLATDAQGNVGDRVRLSWNTQLETVHSDDRSSDHIGLCALRDVDTGVPIHATSSGLEPEGFALYHPLPEEGTEHPAFDGLGALLTAHPATEIGPDSRCPGDRELHFTGEEQHVAGDPSFACLNRSGCEVTVCGRGCGFLPSVDQSLRLSMAFELDDGEVMIDEVVVTHSGGTEIVPRWMKPNLMVVRDERRLVRPMAPLSGQPGRFSWATPVFGNAESGTRWHENFSSNVLVSTARVLFRLPSGSEVGLSGIDGNRILIRSPVATFECTGEPSANGTLFDLASGCRLDGNATALVTTPTYAVQELSEIYGNPLTEPLRWEVAFQEDPLAQGGEVLLELNVRAEFGGAFLKLDLASRDFGRRQIGTLVEAGTSATNVGGKTLRVTSVWLDGNAAADFTVALPSDPRPVPVPIDVRWTESGEYVLEAGADWYDVPLMELVEDEPQGLTLLRASPVDGGSFQLYGDGADGSGSVLYAHDPAADFAAWQPADDEDRPVSRTVWNLRALPFDLSPGESFPIHLRGRPSQLGSLDLTLNVEAFDVTSPSVKVHIASVFQIESIPGPIPGLLPERMTILPDRPRQTFLVMNHGALPLVRGFYEIVGPDAARFQVASQHPLTYTVEAGLEEWFQVEYTPFCSYPYPSHFAELRVVTDAGDLTLDLVGISVCEP